MERRITWITCAVVTLASLLRLFVGVDFSDEAYYLAIPIRFLQGDRPFIDELNLNQAATLVFYPLLWIYHSCFGTEGIVLFARGIFWGVTVGLGAIIVGCLKEQVGKPFALLVAGLALAQIPINIPGLSYNTLGSRFFTMGCVLALHASLHPGKTAFFAGLGSGLGTVCYPTFALPSTLILCLLKGQRKKFALGASLPLIALAALLFRPGVIVADVLQYTRSAYGYGGSFKKFVMSFQFLFWIFKSREIPALYLLLGITVLSRKLPRLQSSALFILPILLTFIFHKTPYPGSWILMYFGFCAPILFLAGPFSPFSRSIFWFLCLPSFIAALAAAWTSSNGPPNAVVGIVPCALAAAFFLWNSRDREMGNLRPIVTLSLLLIFLSFAQFAPRSIYRDGDITQLTSRMPSGPYRGIWTTPSKISFWKEVASDIHQLESEQPRGRIIFYEFPAGHLESRMRPGVSTAWVRDVSRAKQFYTRYYESHQSKENLAFLFRRIDHGKDSTQVHYFPNDSLHDLLKRTHRVVVSRQNYDVLTPQP